IGWIAGAWTVDLEVPKLPTVVGDGKDAVQGRDRGTGNPHVGIVVAVDLQRSHVPRVDVGTHRACLVTERAPAVFGEGHRDGCGRAADRLRAGDADTNGRHQNDDQDGGNTEETQVFHDLFLLTYD